MTSVSCICGGTAIPFYQRGRHQGGFYKGQAKPLYRCPETGHIFFAPMPTGHLLGTFYSEEYYQHRPEDITDVEGFRRDFENNIICHQIKPICEAVIEALNRYSGGHQGKLVHEVGCGDGRAVIRLGREGIRASGSDISSASCGFARLLECQDVHQEEGEAYFARTKLKHDAILSHHCLEHQPEPLSTMKLARENLTPNGVFIARVPNALYFPAQADDFTKWNWFHFPGHLNYFTPRSMAFFLEQAGLRVLEIGTTDLEALGKNVESLWGPGFQLDWLARTFLGRSAKRVREFNKFVTHLSNQMLTRELHVVACRDDSPLLQTHRFINSSTLPREAISRSSLTRFPLYNRIRYQILRNLPNALTSKRLRTAA